MSSRYRERPRTPDQRKAGTLRERILRFLERESTRPLRPRELAKALGVGAEDQRRFSREVKSLTSTGELIRIKGGRYARPSRIHLVKGILRVAGDGHGYASPEKGAEEVTVPPAFMGGAMNGDSVVVRVEGRGRKGLPSGRVIRILERAHRQVVAVLRGGEGAWVARPYDSRLAVDILIPSRQAGRGRDGQLVLVQFTEYPSDGGSARGKVLEVLGQPQELAAETLAVIHRFDLPHHFPSRVQTEASALRQPVPRGSGKGRRDLRDLPFVTIDGVNARDFDDALYSLDRGDGGFTLYAAIADVSFFVKEGSALDLEARNRGNSVYFPETVIPMLPERLSNDFCSLRPKEDRLAFVCEMDLSEDGEPIRHDIYTALIRSSARLTYRQVEEYLSHGRGDLTRAAAKVRTSLDSLHRTFDALSRRRLRRFALDFDFPEPEVVLDVTGHVENIMRAERFLSHRLVEECMLAANEVVARTLREAEVPAVYRIHEPPDPDRIRDLNTLLAAMGHRIPLSAVKSPAPYRSILEAARGTPRERFLNTVVLRSMMRARYSPLPEGHFALALSDYCHFTSPIRRYSDLLVHRALKGFLGLDRTPSAEGLEAACEHISETERTAEEAEREILAFLRALFMADKVGEEYEGVISGITTFGFFVELSEIFVEGLVHLSSLFDDYYWFREESLSLVGEHTGRTFRIGDQVRVRVARVDPGRRHVDFELVP